MNIKNNSIVFSIAFTCLFFLCLLFSGCPTGGESLLWTIKDAVKVPDNSLKNNLTINSMVLAGGDFYIACGTSFFRRSSTDLWQTVPLPAGMALNTAIANAGANLVCGFVSSDGAAGLYTTNSFPVIGWQKIDDGNVNGKQITKFFNANSTTIFCAGTIVSGDVGTFALYTTDGTTVATTLVTDLHQPVLAVVWDTANYWILTSSTIYKTANLAVAPTAYSGSGLSGPFSGMLFSTTTNNYYIASENGVIYYTSNTASSWTGVSNTTDHSTTQTVLGQAVIFSEMAIIGNDILIGTNKVDFYQMKDLANPSETLVRAADKSDLQLKDGSPTNNIINSKLYTAYVLGFFINGNDVYFRTGGNGLISNSFTASIWGSDWTQE